MSILLEVQSPKDFVNLVALGNSLILNYIKNKRLRPSAMIPGYVLAEAVYPPNNPNSAFKFQTAIVQAWPLSPHLFESRTFLCHFGFSTSQKGISKAKSETYYVQFGDYVSTVCFKVNYDLFYSKFPC